MDKERAQAELHYRLSKWIVIDLIKKQLLTENEAMIRHLVGLKNQKRNAYKRLPEKSGGLYH